MASRTNRSIGSLTDQTGYINLGYTGDFNMGTNPFAIEFWAKLPSSGTNNFRCVYYRDCVNTGDWNLLSVTLNSSGEVDFFIRGDYGQDDHPVTSGAGLEDGTWHHYCVQRNGTEVQIWVDGVKLAYGTDHSYNFDGSSSNWKASICGDQFNPEVHGLIAEVRIWKNTYRTEAQIKQNMHKRLLGNESGLIAYYPLDEGTGTTVYDRCTNDTARNGTITGSLVGDWVEDGPPLSGSGKVTII